MTPKVIVYSEAFKMKVVEEYETGQYSLGELQKRYSIGGNTTVAKWVRNKSRSDSLLRKVMIMGPKEQSELQKLKEQVRQLEKVVVNQKIEVIALESMLEVAVEEFGEDFKKNCLQKLSPEVRKNIKIF